jgi:hypothetical protein
MVSKMKHGFSSVVHRLLNFPHYLHLQSRAILLKITMCIIRRIIISNFNQINNIWKGQSWVSTSVSVWVSITKWSMIRGMQTFCLNCTDQCGESTCVAMNDWYLNKRITQGRMFPAVTLAPSPLQRLPPSEEVSVGGEGVYSSPIKANSHIICCAHAVSLWV